MLISDFVGEVCVGSVGALLGCGGSGGGGKGGEPLAWRVGTLAAPDGWLLARAPASPFRSVPLCPPRRRCSPSACRRRRTDNGKILLSLDKSATHPAHVVTPSFLSASTPVFPSLFCGFFFDKNASISTRFWLDIIPNNTFRNRHFLYKVTTLCGFRFFGIGFSDWHYCTIA